MAPPPSLPVVRLKGVRLHALTETECVRHVLAELEAGRGGWIVTPNLDHLRRLTSQEAFAHLCAGASLMVADGMPLVWASRLQGTPLPERVAGSNLVSSVAAAAAADDRSLFLLGGDPGTAERAAQVLTARHPALRILGTHCPPVGFEHDEQAERTLVDALQQAQADIVYVALGSPKQEQLIERVRPLFPATWFLACGISLSFLTGDIRRAPGWLQRLGLEWVHRLAQEPRRLARRYLWQGLPFGASLLTGAAVSGLARRLKGRERG